MNAALRLATVLIDPASAWPRVDAIGDGDGDGDDDPVAALVSSVALLALIPALCRFIGICLIGVVVPEAGTVRAPIVDGLLAALVGYVATFAEVLLLALLIDGLGPLFGGRRKFTDALTLTVYSLTPLWLAGVFLLLPGLHFLTLSGFYGAYLLIAGLPVLMRVPAHKVPTYAALVVAAAVVLTLLIGAAQRALFGAAAL